MSPEGPLRVFWYFATECMLIKIFPKKMFCAFWALDIAPTLDVLVLFFQTAWRVQWMWQKWWMPITSSTRAPLAGGMLGMLLREEWWNWFYRGGCRLLCGWPCYLVQWHCSQMCAAFWLATTYHVTHPLLPSSSTCQSLMHSSSLRWALSAPHASNVITY